MNNTIKDVIEAKNLYKSFQLGDNLVEVLKDINLNIKKVNLFPLWDLLVLGKVLFYIC